jgi:hypothetical protein
MIPFWYVALCYVLIYLANSFQSYSSDTMIHCCMNGSQFFHMKFSDYFKLCEIHNNYTCNGSLHCEYAKIINIVLYSKL